MPSHRLARFVLVLAPLPVAAACHALLGSKPAPAPPPAAPAPASAPAAVGPPRTGAGGDALDDALALVGLRRADLGWQPKGWWLRFPDVPYKLRAFDGLLSRPLDGVAYARTLGGTAAEFLDPAKLNEKSKAGAGRLFQAVQRLGIDPRFGGHRGYHANLTAPPTPLDTALLELTRRAGRPTRFVTFGTESPYPKHVDELARRAKALPEGVSPILGQLVLNVAEAYRWAELAFRRVEPAARSAVARRTNLGEELIDALDYCPEADDVAATWDEASLWYAGLKAVEALDSARTALQALPLRPAPAFVFDWETPWGWVRVRGGGSDTVDGRDTLLVVDLGGDDTYLGGVAASTATRPLGLLLDLAGNDQYRSEVPAQGAGMAGVGVLLDASGNDSYQARHYAQGVGQFGFGVSADLAGDDTWDSRFSSQGCGYFGVGLLLDAAGKDSYRIHAEGQGLGGGGGGVGVLADHGGNDRYVAVREHSVTGRPSYHSPDLDVSVSNAQGSGMGRRGDGADGHSWAGGLGALLDVSGHDVYTSGNWAMGTGYWFGVGVLHDGGGNDEYHGVAYTQATGAHFCVGVLVDEAGDDLHVAEANSHQSVAWGHDFTVAILLNAAGDDRYRVGSRGLGASVNRSVAMLLDTGGKDAYEGDGIPHPGRAEATDRMAVGPGGHGYFADTTSVGLFLDIGGADTYFGKPKNDATWVDPPESPNWKVRNFSVGVDRAEGRLDLTPVPERAPTGVRR